MMTRIAPALSFALFILVWFVAGRLTPQADVFLPAPDKVAAALRDLFVEQDFANDVVQSIYRVMLGFALAMVVGYPLGIAIGVSKAWEGWVQPLNEFARYLPVAALIPLVIVWAGIGDLQKILIIFLGTVFQIVPMVSDTAKRVPNTLLELGQMMGFSRWRRVIKIVIPATAPEVYDHARIALGWAWSYLIVAELVAANTGIGHVIIQAQRFIQTADVMAGIITIGVIGLAFDTIFRMPKRAFFPWTRS
ncbi:MAG TPA: ABC transporter permease [Allosphingosinicella sp.]